MGRSPEAGLAHNTALIADPAQFAGEHRAASWLFLGAWVEEGLRELPESVGR